MYLPIPSSIYPNKKIDTLRVENLYVENLEIRNKISFFCVDLQDQMEMYNNIESIIDILENNGLINNIKNPYIQTYGPLKGNGNYNNQGYSTAISYDGNIIAFGDVISEAMFILINVNGSWKQQGPAILGTDSSNSGYGASCSMDSKGSTLVVGGPGYNQFFGFPEGAIWIFERISTNWVEKNGPLQGTGVPGNIVLFGESVSISQAGDRIVSGGDRYNSGQGAIWIFHKIANVWTEIGGPIVGSGITPGNAYFGKSSDISGDGNYIAVGAPSNNSNQGAIWIYFYNGANWVEQAGPLICSGTSGTPLVGESVSLNYDGTYVAIGAPDNNNDEGACWVFKRTGTVWTEQAGPLIGSESSGIQKQGTSVSISDNGTIIVVGGPYESGDGEGNIWTFKRDGEIWSQYGNKYFGESDTEIINFGFSLDITGDENRIVVGAPLSTNGNGIFIFDKNPDV